MMEAIDPYGSTWYAATAVPHPERERLTVDLDVDVCVVGGGLAGLTTAREIARRGWSVALLEARRIAWNASGRNVGFVLPGFSADEEAMITRVGRARARDLWSLAQQGVEYVRNTITETGMPGVDPADGWLYVSKIDRERDIVAHAAMLRDELGADVEFWPVDLVRAKLKSRRYFQAIHFPTAFHIHPLNYALGLARAAEAAGVRIFEQTPALSIDPTGVRKRIVTPSARVRAGHVVLAGNVHLGGVMPQLSATLVPVSTYVMTTEPLGERALDAIDYRGAVSDGERADNHYRITPDGRLMWSGRVTMWSGNPRRYARGLRRDIRSVYPQLGKVEIAHCWTGVLGTPIHRMPQVGEVAPQLWLASGFSGHGLNTTAMAGEIVARAITEGDQTWKLFTPYELVWAGGAAGKIAAQLVYWGHAVASSVRALVSRNNESNRIAAAERARHEAEMEAERAAEAAVRAEAEKESEEAALAMEKAAQAEDAAVEAAAVEAAPAAESAPVPEPTVAAPEPAAVVTAPAPKPVAPEPVVSDSAPKARKSRAKPAAVAARPRKRSQKRAEKDALTPAELPPAERSETEAR